LTRAFDTLKEDGFNDFLQSKGSTVEQVFQRITSYSETTTCKKP
jgi:hypothetical protein